MQALSRRLEEAEQILEAIRNGAVDAVVVHAPEGDKIYTLQGAEHPYRVLVETMKEGAAIVGPDGKILYCNRRLAAMLQVPLEKMIGSSLSSYIHSADASSCLARVMDGVPLSESREITLVRADGALLPVLLSCSPGEFSGSPATGVIISDISLLKKAEKTILRLNRLYAVLSATNHAILHAADPVSVFREVCRLSVDVGGFRLAWVALAESSHGAATVAAASGETGYLDGIGLSLADDSEGMAPASTSIRHGNHYICNDFSTDPLTAAWHARAHRHGLQAAASISIREGDKVIGALTLYAGEKDFFDVQQVELLQQMGAEISFALDTLQQSALRKEAEQALQAETFERLRAVESLRQNEQMLIHQSRQAAMGEMLGNIAHQWRQPLNRLGLLVQQTQFVYSLGDFDGEYLEKNTEKAMEVIRHMSQTIDDFRDFFRPDKEKVRFNVRNEVIKTLSLMEGSLQGQVMSIDIGVDVQDDPVVEGYPNEFSQVLLNILNNARDALAERRVADPKVTIRVRSEKGKTVVSIADNAGGIPAAIMDRIFEPYFTTKGPQCGTGLGLFMSKTIIEKNMGGVIVARNIDDGAEFIIEI
ncbi:GAF domain-containing protein [Geomonas sp. RF6]|uniref:GAF domain-containing protein n=1 Tax=Geomonas sp. RF6 TaxID=2897342 RepID=UPI001E535F98|nr:GAF domain-containing protein [Geomonas sp. RF6]UFS69969.1 GAF domain-containing protein [Geomonas sp. RF6]